MGGLDIGYLGIAPKSWNKSAKDFFEGTPGSIEQVSTLRPDQEPLSQQLVKAGMKRGAGGAFGTSADYYRDLLSNENADLAAFTAPALRQYNEEIIPGISEQFAGLGAGGLSSSGFRNAQIQGGVDLAERLGQIRANLRHSGAEGLANIGQLGLQRFQENIQIPGTEGFLSNAAPAIGTAAGAAIGGPVGAAIGAGVGGWFNGGANRVGANSSPYGNGGGAASPQTGYRGSFGNLPNYGGR